MDMVVRTLFNNQSWSEPCKGPGKDPGCSLCFYIDRQIERPKAEDEVCSGSCWEEHICTQYRWGYVPKGKVFRNAFRGDKVYFVFAQPNGLYTLWGSTKVSSTDMEVREDGYAYVCFEPFKSLPQGKWVRDLSADALVGDDWRRNPIRYIDAQRESYLSQLIRGHRPEIQPSTTDRTLSIKVKGHVYEKLESIASSEGRSLEDVLREAIAEFIRGRQGNQ